MNSFFSKVIDEKLNRLPRFVPNQTVRFSTSKFKVVMISSAERNEYRYNKLTEIEKFRFFSGHKTILFDKDYKTAISTHTYDDEIRVLKFRCTLKAK
jgi:hypothetical protein